MKGYLRKVVISTATLFLLIALVAPAISANTAINTTDPGCAPTPDAMDSTSSAAPETYSNEEPGAAEPGNEVIELEPPREEEQSEEDPPEIPQEEEDPMAPELPSSEMDGEKSKGHGQGYLRNLEKKSK